MTDKSKVFRLPAQLTINLIKHYAVVALGEDATGTLKEAGKTLLDYFDEEALTNFDKWLEGTKTDELISEAILRAEVCFRKFAGSSDLALAVDDQRGLSFKVEVELIEAISDPHSLQSPSDLEKIVFDLFKRDFGKHIRDEVLRKASSEYILCLRRQLTLINEDKLAPKFIAEGITLNQEGIQEILGEVKATKIIAEETREMVAEIISQGDKRDFIAEHKDKIDDQIKASNSELRIYPNTISGIYIKREEVSQIVAWVMSDESNKKLGILIDQPGGGKSVLMRGALESLEEQGAQVLAIKGDNLDKIRSRKDLSERLGFSFPIEDIIKNFSKNQKFILIIDQIDALSLALSRDQSTLDIILSLVSQLHGSENITILASCRKFDINNDPKLSKIHIDKEFSINPLKPEQVNIILNKFSLEYSHLPTSLQELLTNPLHLEIYARVIESRTGDSPPENFHTLHDLYNALWKRYVDMSSHPSLSPTDLSQAIYSVVDYLQDKKVLSAPIAILDQHREAANYLESIGLFRREKNNILLLHQTFFDFCYTRRFVTKGNLLSIEILNSSQGLFTRSQMINVLAHLRNSNTDTFLREIRALIFSEDIRYHLRLLLIDWLASLPNPSEKEYRIILKMLRNQENANLFLRTAAENPDWFDLLKVIYIPGVLRKEGDILNNHIIHYLGRSTDFRGEEVGDLLHPYMGQSENWDKNIAQIFRFSKDMKSKKVIKIIKELFSRKQTFGNEKSFLHSFAESNPCAGLQILLIHLNNLIQNEKELEEQDDNGRRFWNQEDLINNYEIHFLLESALEKCPNDIVDFLLPWFLETTEKFSTTSYQKNSYPRDNIFSFNLTPDNISSRYCFSLILVEALVIISNQNPKLFLEWVIKIKSTESLSAQLVLALVYLRNQNLYGNEISDYLLEDSRRLKIGDPHEDSNYESLKLLAAAFIHSDNKYHIELETMVMAIEPEWEKKGLGRQGQTKLIYLKSIPKELLSKETLKKFQELERKFPFTIIEPPKGVQVSFVPAPIEIESQKKMSDSDWVKAMLTYDKSSGWGNDPKNFHKGGIVQLSRNYAELVKKDPKRFFELAKKFYKNIPIMYKVASITGLAESECPSTWVFELFNIFESEIKGMERKEVCRAISKRSKENVPKSILNVFSDWARNDPDPEQEKWISNSDDNKKPFYQGEPYGQGINSNRGVAIQAFCRCSLDKDNPNFEDVLELLEISSNDPSTAVRSIVIRELAFLLDIEPLKAIAIFEQTMIGHPGLLKTKHVYNFLYYTRKHYLDRVLPFITKLLEDTEAQSKMAGSMLACLTSFTDPENFLVSELIIEGDKEIRLGAAKVFSRNLEFDENETDCVKYLGLLLNDSDNEVRREIGTCFYHAREEQFQNIKSFIDTFCMSPSLPSGVRALVEYLIKISYDYPKYVLKKLDIILSQIEGKSGILEDKFDIFEKELVSLPLAVYTHTDDEKLKSKAIDLFERLLKTGFYFAQQALNEWDRV